MSQQKGYKKGMLELHTPIGEPDADGDRMCSCGLEYYDGEAEPRVWLPHSCGQWVIGRS